MSLPPRWALRLGRCFKLEPETSGELALASEPGFLGSCGASPGGGRGSEESPRPFSQLRRVSASRGWVYALPLWHSDAQRH